MPGELNQTPFPNELQCRLHWKKKKKSTGNRKKAFYWEITVISLP